MNLKAELLAFLAGLPGIDDLDLRTRLVSETVPVDLDLCFDPYDSNKGFALRLLNAFSQHRPSEFAVFLKNLIYSSILTTPTQRETATRLHRAVVDLINSEQNPSESLNPDDFSFSLPGDGHLHGNEIDSSERNLQPGTAKGLDPDPNLENYTPPTVDQSDQTIYGDQVNVAGTVSQMLLSSERLEIHTLHIHQGSIQGSIYGGNPGQSTFAALQKQPLIEEPIRLDVAAPQEGVQNETFTLAVAVRQPADPRLSVEELIDEELTETASEEGTIFRTELDETIIYRIEVHAGQCVVSPPLCRLRLRPKQSSPPRFFQITPQKSGRCPLLVSAYQEDESVAAQTRLSIAVVVPVDSN